MGKLRRVAFIGTYVPRQCGIATFTSDLCEASAASSPKTDFFAVVVNDAPNTHRYPERVRFEIDQNDLTSYFRAGDFLNMSNVDVVCLQHEYGIYGGVHGAHIVNLARELRMPVVTVLHTVLPEPEPAQKKVLQEVISASDRVVVMCNRASRLLQRVYGAPAEKIDFIHHGIPDVPFVDPNFYKDRFGVEGRLVILTFGLISPDKGIENMIDALPAVVEKFPEVVYIVLGATHPNVKKATGEDYRLTLQAKVREYGIQDNVLFHNRYVTLEELLEFIGCADIYVTPYLNRQQICSGTLAYSLGMGKAVVSTPYVYAEELLADGRGKLVPFRDPRALAHTIIELLEDDAERHAIRKRAYLFGRQMVWREVAKKFLESFLKAKEARVSAPRPLRAKPFRLSHSDELPALNLRHIERLTDSTGILQHARRNVPNRAEGYCTDDNARALIVSILSQRLLTDVNQLERLSTTYLSFLQYALEPETNRFWNMLSYDRKWLSRDRSEDSHSRAVWALGTTVAFSPDSGYRGVAMSLFESALPLVENFTSPRAWAYALLGMHEYLRRFSGDSAVRRMREVLAEKLFELYRKNADEQWQWFEQRLTYANARLAQAMLLCGQWMERGDMAEAGLKALEWLVRVQTAAEGHFVPIGNQGFYERGGARARFDQQPIEACATVSACLEAYRMTGEQRWYEEARKAFDWFLGKNDLHLSLYNFATGGCHDGLQPDRVNLNQGAESTLAWLLSLIEMRFVQHAVGEDEEWEVEPSSSSDTLVTPS